VNAIHSSSQREVKYELKIQYKSLFLQLNKFFTSLTQSLSGDNGKPCQILGYLCIAESDGKIEFLYFSHYDVK
jgi:hypothetical protein